MDSAYSFIITSIFSIIALALGIYILYEDSKNTLNRLIFLICICFVERISSVQLASSEWIGKNEIIFLFKISSFFSHIYFPLNLHFFLFLKEKRKLDLWKIILVYLPWVLLMIVPIINYKSYTDILYLEGRWRYIITSGSIWPYLYISFSIIYSAVTLFISIIHWKQSRLNRVKKQAVLTMIYAVLIAANNFVAILLPLGQSTEASIVVYPTLVYIFGLYYAVFKYRFLAPKPELVIEDLISNINDVVILLDLQYKIMMANKAAGELLSVKPETLEGRNFFEIISNEDNVGEKLTKLTNGNENSFQSGLIYKKDGKDTIVTRTYFSKVKDKFMDMVGILVISNELKGRKEFQKAYRITYREMEIADLILKGNSNEAIGVRLNISERTVETHCNNMYRKLGIKNKADLIRFAAKFNLVP